jgi:hypothetical protein
MLRWKTRAWNTNFNGKTGTFEQTRISTRARFAKINAMLVRQYLKNTPHNNHREFRLRMFPRLKKAELCQ